MVPTYTPPGDPGRSLNLLGWTSIKDFISDVPALGLILAAVGFVIVEVYLGLNYHTYIIDIDIRYLVIASIIALSITLAVPLAGFLLAGPLGLLVGLLIGIPLSLFAVGQFAIPAVDVVLIFKDDVAVSGLPLPIDATSPKRTQIVTKFMDQPDEVLVQDKQTHNVVSVRRDLLSGIVEYVSNAGLPTPLATAAAMP